MTSSSPDRIPSVRPIIILGCPRSGTTLLTTMLHAHPRIAVPPEIRWLKPLYRRRREFGDLRLKANREKVARFIVRRQGQAFADLRIDRELLRKRIADAAPTLGSVAAAFFEEFAASRGKTRWGDKRPSYSNWLDRLLALWPDLQVVHLVRDPRACVPSIVRSSWYRGDFDQAVTLWLRAEEQLRRFERAARPDQYFRLRFEDLVEDSEPVLRDLCGYLGEEFDDAMLQHWSAAEDIVPDRAAHHVRTRGAVDPSRIDAWRSDLTAAQIGAIERVCGRMMRRRGYRPSGLAERPPLSMSVGITAQLWQSRLYARRGRLVDGARRRREPYPLAAATGG